MLDVGVPMRLVKERMTSEGYDRTYLDNFKYRRVKWKQSIVVRRDDIWDGKHAKVSINSQRSFPSCSLYFGMSLSQFYSTFVVDLGRVCTVLQNVECGCPIGRSETPNDI